MSCCTSKGQAICRAGHPPGGPMQWEMSSREYARIVVRREFIGTAASN